MGIVVNRVIQARCYDIIVGYPEWWDYSKKPRKKFVEKAMMTTIAEAQPAIDDKLEPSANVAHSSTVGEANAFSATSKNNTWIINTGVIDHMVRDIGQLQTFHSSTHSFISTPNGSTSPTDGEGIVILTQTLALNPVLVVPSLEYNLLSIGQITSSFNRQTLSFRAYRK